MSVTKRRRQMARRSHWVTHLRLRADQRLGRYPYVNIDEYACRYCSHWSGVVGPCVTDEDWQAEYERNEEIRRHEAGECRPAGIR